MATAALLDPVIVEQTPDALTLDSGLPLIGGQQVKPNVLLLRIGA
jgi:hypothetical protein